MENLYSQIDKIVKSDTNRPSLFQLNFFLLGKEPTIQAKLKRCVDELRVRRESLSAAKLELDELNDQIELLEIDKDREILDAKKEIYARQIDRKINHIRTQMDKVGQRIHGMEEECVFFVNAYDALSEKEAPRPWDDDEVQLEYWSEKYRREIQDRRYFNKPIDIEIIKSIMALPDQSSAKKELVAMAIMDNKQMMLKG